MLFRDHHYSHEFLHVLAFLGLEPLVCGSLAALAAGDVRWTGRFGRRRPLMVGAVVLLLMGVLLAGQKGEPYFIPMATSGFPAFALIYTPLVFYAFLRSGSSQRLGSTLLRPVQYPSEDMHMRGSNVFLPSILNLMRTQNAHKPPV